jgi:hypothetical protein
MPTHTVKQLRELHETESALHWALCDQFGCMDLKIEPAEPEWKPEWQNLFDQLTLFGPVQKPLRKIPYKFSYVFECEDSHRPHNAMIEDWELGVLWLNEVARLGR